MTFYHTVITASQFIPGDFERDEAVVIASLVLGHYPSEELAESMRAETAARIDDLYKLDESEAGNFIKMVTQTSPGQAHFQVAVLSSDMLKQAWPVAAPPRVEVEPEARRVPTFREPDVWM